MQTEAAQCTAYDAEVTVVRCENEFIFLSWLYANKTQAATGSGVAKCLPPQSSRSTHAPTTEC